MVSAAARLKERPTARKPEDGPAPDLRFIDRLSYMLNGAGFTYDRPGNLWRVVRRRRGRHAPDERHRR